jgi:hypothetical protein
MSATRLSKEDFRKYPPQARALVGENLALLQQLPQALLALLLREIIAFDWKFPAERDEIERQLRYLASLNPRQLANAMSPFAKIELSPDLEQADWIGNPSRFSEQFSAHLWATHQIDGFGKAAENYIAAFNAAVPEKAAVAPRLGIAVIGKEIGETGYPRFRKLRAHGTYFTAVDRNSDYNVLLNAVAERAHKYPAPYAHWCIHGADNPALESKQVASISYRSLASVRGDLIRKMRESSASRLGPEALRTRLAETEPASVGMNTPGADAVLSHFSVSVLTEGAGTQLYSTTFVQWTAREALRRARPLTLLARFAPRQTEESADEEMQGIQVSPAFDLPGSLVDADMGAYYTWINLQRLSGAEDSTFLAWFEGHNEALAISPSLAPGKEYNDKVDLAEVLRRMQSTA